MKKVLIITYYFPPSGGAGVQRMLKLVRYLREFGWEPVVYTADAAAYPILDASLEKEIPEGIRILRHKIWEPYELYKKLIGQKKEEAVYSGFISEHKKMSLTQKLSIWIRGNFFIPDARRFWIRPSVKFLLRELKQHPVDAILSSGPPHTTHLIALGVKKKSGLPWLADFRDPWTHIDFYDQLMLTRYADRQHKRMEQQVLHHADAIDTVSWHWAEDFEKLSGKKVQVITNGYDEADFADAPGEADQAQSEHFVIAHIGSLNKDRNHAVLWEALQELCESHAGFKAKLLIQLIGKNDFGVYEAIEKHGLTASLQRIDYLPHHEVGPYQRRAAVLYLPINNTPNALGVVPGKLFEYLAARRPILLIGTEAGDSARIVREAGAGVVCDWQDRRGVKAALLQLFEQWKAGTSSVDTKDLAQYSRRRMAANFAAALEEITGRKGGK